MDDKQKEDIFSIDKMEPQGRKIVFLIGFHTFYWFLNVSISGYWSDYFFVWAS